MAMEWMFQAKDGSDCDLTGRVLANDRSLPNRYRARDQVISHRSAAAITTSARPLSVARWVLVLFPVVIVVVGGCDHRWVNEDAFIDFRVVHNLLGGHGPVFNVGERVEVYTDPLWVAILTLAYGVFRFIPLEWWSVLLGLVFTGAGVAFGGLTAMRLGARHGSRAVFPVGMLCVSVVAGVWDFSTSGLETGLIFGWMGLTWWMVVRAREDGASLVSSALVAGLGVIIRPDLFLVSLAFGCALACVVASRRRGVPIPAWRKYAGPAAAFVAIPVASELFRIAYFGLLVPNTALAKSALATWWSQGWAYLVDFVHPYWLWIPMLILVAVTAVRTRRWWSQGHRLDCIVLAAPALGGILNALYVVSIGGDFMHARMLLPGFFGLSLALWIDLESVGERRLPLVATLVWASVCLVALRYTEPGIGPLGIANERSYYVAATGNPHPTTLSDYTNEAWEQYGQLLQDQAQGDSGAGLKMLVNPPPLADGPLPPLVVVARRSGFPEKLVAPTLNIGVMGDAAGSDVYIFDQLSLANPVSSHFAATTRGRPGHEKYAALVWMVGRFGVPGESLPPGVANARSIYDARTALSCQPLSGYLHAISSPLTLGDVVSNFAHTFTWTTMKYSSNPLPAALQLCY